MYTVRKVFYDSATTASSYLLDDTTVSNQPDAYGIYRQKPQTFEHTSIADIPNLEGTKALEAAQAICNEFNRKRTVYPRIEGGMLQGVCGPDNIEIDLWDGDVEGEPQEHWQERIKADTDATDIY